MRNVRILRHLALLTCLVCTSCSCRSEPRSADEILREEMELPALYLTAETKTRVTAPTGKGVFVDEGTGELCWPALACQAPDCPGRRDGDPFLFIAPDPGTIVQADGTIGYDYERAMQADKMLGACPECLKHRNLAGETDRQRQQYIDWVQPYVLPRTAERLKELGAERRGQ